MHAGIRKVIRNGKGWKLSIPRQVIELLGWAHRQHIEIVINADQTVTLKAVELTLDQPHRPEARV